jgi:hypothetical protein
MRKLVVHRKAYCKKGYHRKAYTKKRGIHVPATHVKPHCIGSTSFRIRDIGAVGRSRMPAGMRPLKHGRMTYAVARALGYAKHPSELTATEWKKVFDRSGVGGRAWLGMLATQVARRKFAKSGERAEAKKAFQKAIAILKEERKGELIPVEAIRKRMLMHRLHRVM